MAAVAEQQLRRRVCVPSEESTCRVRRELRSALARWDLGPEIAEDALVVVEELLANVVDHARTRCDLVVEQVGNVVLVAVRDHSTGAPVICAVDTTAPRGRGLQLVSGLSESWGCAPHPGGKTVWARLAA
jgi:anti-sigma regulatory factor (Ser/Thr protein kinase)